jgi:hypothetical protein
MPPENRVLPSGEKAIETTRHLCPPQGGEWLAGVGLPELHAAAGIAGDLAGGPPPGREPLAVRAEGDARHHAVLREAAHLLPRAHLAEP